MKERFRCLLLLGSAVVASLGVFFTLTISKPASSILNSSLQNPVLRHLFKIRLPIAFVEGTPEKLIIARSQLKDLKLDCWSLTQLLPLSTPKIIALSTHFRNDAAIILDENPTDFRPYLWKLRFKDQWQSQCLIPPPSKSSKLSKDDIYKLAVDQYSALHRALETFPISQELSLRNPAGLDKIRLLSFGFINGPALITLDEKPIAYFRTPMDSGEIIPVTVPSKKTVTLALTYLGTNQTAAGVSQHQFSGLYPAEKPPVDLFSDRDQRLTGALITYTITVICTMILISFCWFRRPLSWWAYLLCVNLSFFSLWRASKDIEFFLMIDQIPLWLLRKVPVPILLITSAGIVLETILYSFAGLNRLFEGKKQKERILLYAKYLVVIAFCFPVIRDICKLIYESFAPASWEFYIQQNILLDAVMKKGLFFSVVFLPLNFAYLEIARRNGSEGAYLDARRFVTTACASVGTTFLLSVSFSTFLSNWFFQGHSTQMSSVFSLQITPVVLVLVTAGLLSLLLKEQKLAERVLPPASREMLLEGNIEEVVHRTKSDNNWFVWNDIVGSTPRKMQDLAIRSHILQSVFHKLHKDYIGDAAHHIQTLGDCVILALKSPNDPAQGDSLLEKLVRCYVLHHDGSELMRENAHTSTLLLALENKEIFDAMTKSGLLQRSATDKFHFRTILSSGLYYYGFNHEIGTIDAPGIYKIAKTEKLIKGAEHGGFIIFPELFAIIERFLPTLVPYFTRAECTETADSPIQLNLPKAVYILDLENRAQFEQQLTRLYGRPLFLREDHESKRNLSDIRSETKVWAENMRTLHSVDEVITALNNNSVNFTNFREKNLAIEAIAERVLELKIWDQPKNAKIVSEKLKRIGASSIGILNSINKRDKSLEPSRIIASLIKSDPVSRSKIIRLLPIVRTRSLLRPDNATEETFYFEICKNIVSRRLVFSVESHQLLIMRIEETLDRQRAAKAAFNSASDKEKRIFLEALEKFDAPSMKNVFQFWNNLNEIENKIAA